MTAQNPIPTTYPYADIARYEHAGTKLPAFDTIEARGWLSAATADLRKTYAGQAEWFLNRYTLRPFAATPPEIAERFVQMRAQCPYATFAQLYRRVKGDPLLKVVLAYYVHHLRGHEVAEWVRSPLP